MTLNLAAIEPLKAGCDGNVSPDLSERIAMGASFAPPPDSAAAEMFQFVMADGVAKADRTVSLKLSEVRASVVDAFGSAEQSEILGPLNTGCERVLPEDRKSTGRDIFVASQSMGNVPMWRCEDVPPCQGVHAPVVPQKDVPVATQETEATTTDEPLGQIVRASESDPKAVSVMQDPVAGLGVPLNRVESPSAKSVPAELLDVVGNDIRKAGAYGAEIGRAVSPKPPEVKDDVVRTFGERALPDKKALVDVGERVRPGKGMFVGRDVPVELHSMIRSHEMPTDSHESVQIIAPAPLPIELPAAAVQRQSAAAVATPDTVKMFVAAAEAVADAILVSSGFENGEGRILVRLQPEVLGGSEIHITVKGGTLTVVVNPASQDVQMIVEANRTQFEQHLAEKVHSWRIAVAVKKGDKIDERV